ncbi:MAG: SDR family oxidoreductase [Planctomycetaceae bacterium]|jgi:enoyl-[acyl-carrier protein] reductase III|nr:SDR family oxidoreductase [Planctomycetaceae bacterium]
MINLKNKVALITGASRGIGKATALKLAEAGADIVVNYHTNREAALDTARKINALGQDAFVVKGDVAEKEDIESMIDFVTEKIGHLDIVVSNAASGGFRPLLTATENNFDAAMKTNVLPLIYLVQASCKLLKQNRHRGKVIAISSHGSRLALPFYGLIGASKAALESTVRHLTLEVGDYANVNVVLSGLVVTDSTNALLGSPEIFARRTEKTMTGNRVLEAEDVANAVCFLASSMSDMVQGATLSVDGGAINHI